MILTRIFSLKNSFRDGQLGIWVCTILLKGPSFELMYFIKPLTARCPGLKPLLAELGRVDKRDSHGGSCVIQAGICYGDQLAPRPYERRRVVAV